MAAKLETGYEPPREEAIVDETFAVSQNKPLALEAKTVSVLNDEHGVSQQSTQMSPTETTMLSGLDSAQDKDVDMANIFQLPDANLFNEAYHGRGKSAVASSNSCGDAGLKHPSGDLADTLIDSDNELETDPLAIEEPTSLSVPVVQELVDSIDAATAKRLETALFYDPAMVYPMNTLRSNPELHTFAPPNSEEDNFIDERDLIPVVPLSRWAIRKRPADTDSSRSTKECKYLPSTNRYDATELVSPIFLSRRGKDTLATGLQRPMQLKSNIVWSPDEDDMLLHAVRVYQQNWPLICDVLNSGFIAPGQTRTQSDCMSRYQTLMKNPHLASQQRDMLCKTKKDALVRQKMNKVESRKRIARHYAVFDIIKKCAKNRPVLSARPPASGTKKVSLGTHPSHTSAAKEAGANPKKVVSPIEIISRKMAVGGARPTASDFGAGMPMSPAKRLEQAVSETAHKVQDSVGPAAIHSSGHSSSATSNNVPATHVRPFRMSAEATSAALAGSRFYGMAHSMDGKVFQGGPQMMGRPGGIPGYPAMGGMNPAAFHTPRPTPGLPHGSPSMAGATFVNSPKPGMVNPMVLSGASANQLVQMSKMLKQSQMAQKAQMMGLRPPRPMPHPTMPGSGVAVGQPGVLGGFPKPGYPTAQPGGAMPAGANTMMLAKMQAAAQQQQRHSSQPHNSGASASSEKSMPNSQ